MLSFRASAVSVRLVPPLRSSVHMSSVHMSSVLMSAGKQHCLPTHYERVCCFLWTRVLGARVLLLGVGGNLKG
jgi:hypothetical protein